LSNTSFFHRSAIVTELAKHKEKYKEYFCSMMTWTFFNDGRTACMYPLGPSHRNGALRVGALSIKELWDGGVKEYITKSEQAIAQKVHFAMSKGALNDRWLPSDNAFSALATLPVGVDLWHKDTVLFRWISSEATPSHSHQLINEADLLSAPHDLFTRAGDWIQDKRCRFQVFGMLKMRGKLHCLST